jgi:hypothetical protein
MKLTPPSPITPVVCALALILANTGFGQVSYTNQIRPLLDQKCGLCHNAADRAGGFDASSPDSLQKGGAKAGPGVVPGKPAESAVIQYVEGKRQPRMPKGMPPLAPDQIRILRDWIAAGAPSDSPAPTQTKFVPTNPTSLNNVAKEQLVQALFTNDREQLMVARRNLRLPPAPSANSIDNLIAAKWKDKTAPALCDDVTFLRRAYLDVIGVIPTIVEAQHFLTSKQPDRRAALIDELLARTNDYAAHWTPFWEEALGSSTAPITGGIPNHGNHREWIFKNFAANRPFDVLVAELIDPTMPGHPKFSDGNANGTILRIGYVLNNNHTETIQSASNVAQVFMATSMKCASCHNHFLNSEWPQSRFMAFAGLFSPTDLELIRCERKSNQFVPAKFPFEVPGVEQPTQATGDQRLSFAAALITDPQNPRFAKAIVNRLWRRYLGVGLFEPIDDFRNDRPAVNPELLEWLAADFMHSGYDLKHTIRLILNSRTYQHKYDPTQEDHFDVSKPNEPRYYRSPSLRKLTAEQLLDSVIVAGTQKLEPEKRVYLDKTTTALTRALGRPASRNEISTARSEEVAVVQALELVNGEEFHDLVYSGPILDDGTSDKLYWAALSRGPSETEQASAAKYLQNKFVPTNPPAEISWIDNNFPAASPLGKTPGLTRRLYQNAGSPLPFGPKDVLYAEGLIDPQDPPEQITMQWQIIGQDAFIYRTSWGTANSKHPLPEPGKWVRFEIPLSELTPRSASGKITGWVFDQKGGKIEWRKAGIRIAPTNPNTEMLGDILWALTSSPEFQYIR